MKAKFRNIKELFKEFSGDQKCREYLEHQRWDGKPSCPHCGHERAYKLGDNKTYKCASNKCYKKFTVTVGTIFENTNIPLSTWFGAIYLVSAHKKGVSSAQMARDLGITQKSAWFMLHRIREMARKKHPEKMGGAVEADETYVGGKAANWHQGKREEMRKAGTGYVHKTPVFGLLKRSGEVYTFVPKEATGEHLKPIIINTVEPKSVLMTDGFGAYAGLDKTYQHEVINHQQGEYFREGFHTNTIEGFWSLLKRGIVGTYHYISPKHLHRYCDEFAYRYNTRKMSDPERFSISLQNTDGRLTYKQLITRPK